MANKRRYTVEGRGLKFQDPFTGEWYPVLESKKGLPYVSGGGFQLFFRERPAIERLIEAAQLGAENVRFTEGDGDGKAMGD